MKTNSLGTCFVSWNSNNCNGDTTQSTLVVAAIYFFRIQLFRMCFAFFDNLTTLLYECTPIIRFLMHTIEVELKY